MEIGTSTELRTRAHAPAEAHHASAMMRAVVRSRAHHAVAAVMMMRVGMGTVMRSVMLRSIEGETRGTGRERATCACLGHACLPSSLPSATALAPTELGSLVLGRSSRSGGGLVQGSGGRGISSSVALGRSGSRVRSTSRKPGSRRLRAQRRGSFIGHRVLSTHACKPALSTRSREREVKRKNRILGRQTQRLRELVTRVDRDDISFGVAVGEASRRSVQRRLEAKSGDDPVGERLVGQLSLLERRSLGLAAMCDLDRDHSFFSRVSHSFFLPSISTSSESSLRRKTEKLRLRRIHSGCCCLLDSVSPRQSILQASLFLQLRWDGV